MRLLALRVPGRDGELAADRLWSVGARAVEERDLPGDRTELRASLGSDDAISRDRLGPVPEDWIVEFIDVDERPADTWREFAEPIVVGERLVLQPAWIPPIGGAQRLTIAIEPGGAFGLGDHPTTRLSAALIDELAQPGQLVLDVGCGSGVLAVIAAKRGASRVVAIDISEAAREATVANAQRNQVGIVEASTEPLESVAGAFDLVAANILAPTLIELAPHLRRATARGGRLVISGVLAGGYDHVVAALAPMLVVEARDLDGWSAVVLRHADEA